MTDLNDIADQLNRLIKLALDTGEASTIEEAHQIFAGYRMQIVVGADVAHQPVLQAALLTAVNCAARSLLGGVVVVGATGSLCVPLPPYADTAEALVAMGAIRLVHRQEQSPRRNEQPQRRRSDYRASGLVLRPKAARRKLRKRPFIE